VFAANVTVGGAPIAILSLVLVVFVSMEGIEAAFIKLSTHIILAIDRCIHESLATLYVECSIARLINASPRLSRVFWH
jgi:hypothetical protein